MAEVVAGYFLFLSESLHAVCHRGNLKQNKTKKNKQKRVVGFGFMSLCVAFCFCQPVTLKEERGSQIVGKGMLDSRGVQMHWHGHWSSCITSWVYV